MPGEGAAGLWPAALAEGRGGRGARGRGRERGRAPAWKPAGIDRGAVSVARQSRHWQAGLAGSGRVLACAGLSERRARDGCVRADSVMGEEDAIASLAIVADRTAPCVLVHRNWRLPSLIKPLFHSPPRPLPPGAHPLRRSLFLAPSPVPCFAMVGLDRHLHSHAPCNADCA